ncbi:MAG: MFS transporter [Microbacterium sp.]|nr:MFS transporter [Microbacterium sp.]
MTRRTARLALPVAFLALTFSSGATMLAVMVTVASGRSAGWAVPVAVLCASVPQIVLAPLAAPLLDRVGPRRVVIASTAAQAALLLTAAAFPIMPVLIGVVAAKSAVSALDGAAFMLLAERASRAEGSDTAARAFARLDTARLIGSLLGPALGGVVMHLIGVSWVFMIDAVAVGACGIAVFFTPRGDFGTSTAPTTWWQRVREAPALLFQNPTTRVALAGLSTAIVFTSFYAVAEVLYALDVLELDPLGYGVLSLCFVIGRLVGAQAGGRVTVQAAPRLLLAATCVMGMGLLLPGVWHSVIAAGAGFAIAGLANATQVAAIRLIVIGAVPDDLRGRSLSTMASVNQTAGVLGTAAAAPVVAGLGPAGTLVLAGAGTLLVGVTAAAFRSRSAPRPVSARRGPS